MDRTHIAYEARRLQYEIWQKRALLFQMGEPTLHAMFDPRVAARVLDLEYEQRERIGSGQAGWEAAGVLNCDRGIISISSKFNYFVQRFTGAHEIGHFVLHREQIGATIHRDRPIFELHASGRPPIEREADYFAACFLAPKKLVIEEFKKRFVNNPPLQLDENVAFHLYGEMASDLFIAPPGSLNFAAAVAGAQKFDRLRFPSLAEQFGLSVRAMAIRLQELELVRD